MTPAAVYSHSDAEISDDALGAYRYRLRRFWSPPLDAPLPLFEETGQAPDVWEPLVWVMLNPSTASAELDDNTLRRVVAFSKREGYAGAVLLNLFAYRSRDPQALTQVEDPVGPENDDWIRKTLDQVEPHQVVVAWGGHVVPRHQDRAGQVLSIIRDEAYATPVRLGPPTRSGAPRHPLYVEASTPLEPHEGDR